jgi:hypothetical protein
MTDYEPYVADPAEPKPRPWLARLRPLVVTLIIAIIAGAVLFMFIRDRAEQDPSLEVPVEDLQEVEPAQD